MIQRPVHSFEWPSGSAAQILILPASTTDNVSPMAFLIVILSVLTESNPLSTSTHMYQCSDVGV